VVTGIADRLGGLTDKFALGYYPAYEELAALIGPAGQVLEVGVYEGGSLRMWQELFPRGVVAGVDCNPDAGWPAGTVRIVADQASDTMADQAAAASPCGWDLVVDDASHIASASSETRRLLWPQVKPGRWYVLEDWAVGYMEPFVAEFGPGMLRYAESFLTELGPRGGVDEIRYRYSQAIIRKKGGSG
jgi:hypothetical protein